MLFILPAVSFILILPINAVVVTYSIVSMGLYGRCSSTDQLTLHNLLLPQSFLQKQPPKLTLNLTRSKNNLAHLSCNSYTAVTQTKRVSQNLPLYLREYKETDFWGSQIQSWSSYIFCQNSLNPRFQKETMWQCVLPSSSLKMKMHSSLAFFFAQLEH